MGLATYGLLTIAAAVTGATISAVGTAVAFQATSDEGTSRSLTFWYHCLPVYLEYRTVQFRNKDLGERGWNVPQWTGLPLDDASANESYTALHEKHSLPIRDLVLKMRGFYFKNAQLLSTRDDFVPSQYLNWCKETQDAAPCEMKPGEAKEIVTNALQKKLGKKVKFDDVFCKWNETPIGVASIGTVHEAKLSKKYGGHQVVIKVQAPGIERRFRADIKTCIDFCKLAMPQHAPPLEEIEKQFLTEFDYCEEAKNLLEVRSHLLPKWANKIDIPTPFPNLCTKEVLVMSKLPGKKLVDGVRERLTAIAKFRNTTAEVLEKKQREKIASGILIAKDVDRESKSTNRTNLSLTLIDQLVRRPFCLLTGQRFEPSPKLINMASVLKVLLDVHAEEIFSHGTFNGDPHPGNILLMPDGKLGLIDYGQVTRINMDARRNYAKLLLAILAEDKGEIARICQSAEPDGFGGKSKKSNKDVSYKLAVFWNDRDTPDVTGGLNLQEFLDEMEYRDPVVKAPTDMVMIARVSMLLRGMANAFNVRLRVAEAWRESAESVLRETDPAYYLLLKGNAGTESVKRSSAQRGSYLS